MEAGGRVAERAQAPPLPPSLLLSRQILAPAYRSLSLGDVLESWRCPSGLTMRSSVPLLEVIARFRRGSELREAIGQGRIVIAVGPSRVWNHIWSSSCPRSGPDNDVVCSQAILPLYTLLGSCWELPDYRITLSGTVEGGGGAASPHLAGGRAAIHHMRGVHMERRRTQGSPMLGDWRRACRMINAPTGLLQIFVAIRLLRA